MRRIEQISGDFLAVNQGTLYPLLLRLEHDGSIANGMVRRLLTSFSRKH